MAKKEITGKTTREFEKALLKKKKELYVLRLYITGTTQNSVSAIKNIKNLCEENLEGSYDLEVIDIFQEAEKAKEEQIVVAPTLVKKLPLPLRRIIGDLSNKEKLIVGLDLRKISNKKGKKI